VAELGKNLETVFFPMKPGEYHIHWVSSIFFLKMTWGILKNEMPNETNEKRLPNSTYFSSPPSYAKICV
jgi:hypothetical protein